jgi:crotonobetainyl-CoA hydratase
MADEARNFGLLNEVVTFADLPAAARKWAAKLNAASPLAVRAAKAAANGGLGLPLELALSQRFEPIEAYSATDDSKESAQARIEGRRPVWKGQ